MPSKPEITKAIKKTVKEIFETDPDSLTVNHVRTIVSAQLDLDEDFLKTDPFWKNESKDLVKTEYVGMRDFVTVWLLTERSRDDLKVVLRRILK